MTKKKNTPKRKPKVDVNLDLDVFGYGKRTIQIFGEIYPLPRIPTKKRLEFKRIMMETSEYYDNPEKELEALEKQQEAIKLVIPTIPDEVVEELDYPEINEIFLDMELQYIRIRFGEAAAQEAEKAMKDAMKEGFQKPMKMMEEETPE